MFLCKKCKSSEVGIFGENHTLNCLQNQIDNLNKKIEALKGIEGIDDLNDYIFKLKLRLHKIIFPNPYE